MDRRTVLGTVFSGTFALGGSSLIALTALPNQSPYLTVLLSAGAFLAVVGVAGLIGLLLIPAKQLASDRNEEGNVATQTNGTSVTSFNQTGGITAQTVNLAPPRRILNEDGGRYLLSRIPEDRIIVVDCVHGDGEADAFARQIVDFLARAGRPMAKPVLNYTIKGPPDRGQSIDLESDPSKARIIIGIQE